MQSMRGWRVTLALCVVGACCAAAGPTQRREEGDAHAQQAPGAQRTRRSVNALTKLIADVYARGAMGAMGAGGAVGAGAGGWLPPPMPVYVPMPNDNEGRASGVSLLVVPVPFPVPAHRDAAQCPLNAQQTQTAAVAPTTAPARSVSVVNNDVTGLTYTNTASDDYARQAYNLQTNIQPQAYSPFYNPVPSYDPNPVPTNSPVSPPPAPAPVAIPTPAPSPVPKRPATDERLKRTAPNFPPVEDSRLLVELFRAQEHADLKLPPVVIDPIGVVSTDDYTVLELQEAKPSSNAPASGDKPAPQRRVLKCKRLKTEVDADEERAPPPPPRFEQSLYIRARLSVPRAGYTEPYSVWWDAASGASRVDFHGGSASTYRMTQSDGRMRSILLRVDRTGETDVRRCVVSAPRRVAAAERGLPILPDLRVFSFAGYVQHDKQRLELWRHTLSGHSGELGGVRGEALTFRHELLLRRSPDNFTTTPIRYSVRVDSSVLGADCDSYVHYFDKVETRHHDTALFNLNIGDACEQVETTNRMDSVEPLREFIMLRRDPRYDAEYDQYKRLYQRRYADDIEEAVRKNILMQTLRFVSSGNREGASFELGSNFVADRLVVERRVLLGAADDGAGAAALPFTHSREELAALRGRLPRRFDWRKLGGVTHVRNQQMCSSCWAFATTGSVEGALFVQSGRLVPLSEQALVDCGKRNGANGCGNTWPDRAYEYIKESGLPALEEYTPYKGEELQCRADRVPPVTRIAGYTKVPKHNLLALKTSIRKYGPTVVIIDALTDSFMSYKEGFYHDAKCKNNSLNHAVLAVGWTTHRSETYFILKNSWSAGWGDGGYVKVRGPTNTCGVLNRPSVAVVGARDVLRVPAASPSAATPPERAPMISST